ncbi:hypothetical protein Ndes2437A_g01156 [Nannochloris sp. 'desiccata']
MLPRLRASAKKTIGLLERRVSSSKQNLKQTNETSGCGKSRFLKEMVDQLGLGQDPPPVIFINSRLKACDSNR